MTTTIFFAAWACLLGSFCWGMADWDKFLGRFALGALAWALLLGVWLGRLLS